MYYNMRIKTLKRNTTNILRKGKEALLARKSQVMMIYAFCTLKPQPYG
jgi:hypothetical protein